MLEKFLKFLRGDGEDSENVEGSYLTVVLRRVQPRLVERLDACPEHDPLPLLIAELLREVESGRFDEEPECPVTDAQSPPLPNESEALGEERSEPPPPPDGPDDEGDGADRDEAPDTDDSTEDASEEAADDADDNDADEKSRDGEVRGDDVPEGEDESGDVEVEEPTDDEEAERDREPADVSESDTDDDGSSDDSDQTDDDASDDASDGADAEEGTDGSDTDEYFTKQEPEAEVRQEPPNSVEAERNRADNRGEIVDSAGSDVGPPRVDSEIVLEMGRVLLGMLVENDALPVELQMEADEIDEARQLLAGYFLGDDLVDGRARDMLRMVENKFDEGLFSQARILLQLFDADKQTRIENDRNLFYEEMILRFGIQRRHPVGDELHERFDERIDQYEDSEEDLEELLVWLSESIYVTLDIYGRNQQRVEQWREISELSERPGASERLLEVVPPERWRLLDEYGRSAPTILEEQLTAEYVEDYVTEHVKTCYFILRAVGDTGLEPYLDVFFDWVDTEFDVDGPRLMPWLYTETTANERLIDDIFEELYAEHFEPQVDAAREEWDRDQIDEALDSVVERVGTTDLGDMPPGHYDLGRFVLDELFDIEYPSEDFPFKMHRLT